jgi:UDP-N-acetylmuramoyl-tripeptide--D-alanyl-D-alanine ligase (fragment)
MLRDKFKNYVRDKLKKYVKDYFKVHQDVKLIAVGGSVGKTTTKMAIGTVLSADKRIRLEENNHNTDFSAPLAILGVKYPENVNSVMAWLRVFKACKKRIKNPSDVDVIIQELGTDHPGEMEYFASFLNPDYGVLTGISPEHMEFFGSLDNVAKEEMTILNMSKMGLINQDDVDARYANLLTNKNVKGYGMLSGVQYQLKIDSFDIQKGYSASVVGPDGVNIAMDVNVFGRHSLKALAAAITIAKEMNVPTEHIIQGVSRMHPVPGRMQLLRGYNDSILIDDTYNASPVSIREALRFLYEEINSPQKIVILGDMNEMGIESKKLHEDVGELMDGNHIDWLVTVGELTRKYTAPIAKERGVNVMSFDSALSAGAFAKSKIEKGAVVLVKGSQNKIYTEEALKLILHDIKDSRKLVRQSEPWLEKKAEFFKTQSL